MGDEGSSRGGEGRAVACWRGAGVDEAGMRSGGGLVGGRSGSEGRRRGGIEAGLGGVVDSGTSKVTFFGDFFVSGTLSVESGGRKPRSESVRPSSRFAFFSSVSMSDGLNPVNNSLLASSISSIDICDIRCLFSSSIVRLSSSMLNESFCASAESHAP